MVTIAHALKPLNYRRIQLGHMHWTDLEMDTGYEPWITHDEWRRAMPKEVLDRYSWEAQDITRRTTGGPSTRLRNQYSGHYVATNAIREITSAVRGNENFLCWAAFSEPHPPFYPPREIYEKIDQSEIQLPQQARAEHRPPHEYIVERRREWQHLTEIEIRQMIAGYYGMVELVDGYCGMVLNALDELGVRDETIVIWTVDHGDQMWEHELFVKFNMYEGSVHVPILIDVPGQGPAVRTELVEHIDLFPTICELVGARCPEGVQGRSLLPLLGNGPTPSGWRDAVFSEESRRAIGGNLEMIRTKSMKLNVYNRVPGELYDLREDPGELDNRITDPQYEGTISQLLERLKEWEKTTPQDQTSRTQTTSPRTP
jgi:arylsulfatase A-like enzyme